jgi:hypothetical protein
VGYAPWMDTIWSEIIQSKHLYDMATYSYFLTFCLVNCIAAIISISVGVLAINLFDSIQRLQNVDFNCFDRWLKRRSVCTLKTMIYVFPTCLGISAICCYILLNIRF